MNPKNTPNYHHWVEYSSEDECFIGYCPDLFFGGVCHDDDEIATYKKLVQIINEELNSLEKLPPKKVKPMAEILG